ncbi:MAG: glycosyltransferase family 39 protein [Rhizomicrobium sp.]
MPSEPDVSHNAALPIGEDGGFDETARTAAQMAVAAHVDVTGIPFPTLAFHSLFYRSVEERLAGAVPYVIAAYAGAWVLVQWLTFSGLRFDAYEMLLMGHEWQLAYWKHPALPPWMAEAVFELSGRSTAAMAVLPVACAAVALWLVWRLCRPILGTTGAALATGLSLCSWYLMTPVTQFNHNVAQLPFWVLTVLCYRRAILKSSYANWIAFGVVAALLLQTKYTGVLLLATLAVHACWFETSRRQLRTPQAWTGIAVAIALILPQLFQLVLHDRSALTYAVDRPPYRSLYDHVLGPLALLGSQAFFHVAVLILVLAARPYNAAQRAGAVAFTLPKRTPFDTSLLIAGMAGPLALGLIFYGIAGVWGRPEALGSMFMLVGPAVIACAGRTLVIARPRLVLAFFALTVFGMPVCSILDSFMHPIVFHRLRTEQIPFAAATDAMEFDWWRLTGRPLTILAGDTAIAGGFAAYMEPRPSVLIDGMRDRSPWITAKRITSEGVMIVWLIKDARQPLPPSELVKPLAGYAIERIAPLRVVTRWDRYVPPVLFGRAIIRPAQTSMSSTQ